MVGSVCKSDVTSVCVYDWLLVGSLLLLPSNSPRNPGDSTENPVEEFSYTDRLRLIVLLFWLSEAIDENFCYSNDFFLFLRFFNSEKSIAYKRMSWP